MYSKVTEEKEIEVVKHNNECSGINSIARLVKLSKTTVLRILNKKANGMLKPAFSESDQEYEMDELHTYVGHKKNWCYVIYALNKLTGKVIDLVVGKRTNENLGKVVNSLLKLNPLKIYTDNLNSYPGLIPKEIHRTKKYKTNRIERNNLNLRNSLKRLVRKTICYSKSETMLEACVKLCVWK